MIESRQPLAGAEESPAVSLPRLSTARRVLAYTADAAALFTAAHGLTNILAMYQVGAVPAWRSLLLTAALVSVLVLFTRIHRAAFARTARPTRLLVVSGLLAAVALALSTAGGEFTAIIWLMGMATHVRLRTTLSLAGLVLVAATVSIILHEVFLLQTIAVNEGMWYGYLYSAFSMLIWTLAPTALVAASVWMWHTLQIAQQGQQARARLALSEERLRFSRDLHDVLGHHLSVISLKSELATKLSPPEAERSRTEIAEVHRLARTALSETRSVVHSYRTLDLDEELDGVRATLQAAGVRCTLDVNTTQQPEEVRGVLAWAVREGATNVLRHSSASYTTIRIIAGTLELRNDGVNPAANDGASSGLSGLTERVNAAGGRLSTESTASGEFVLRVTVPG